MLTSMQMGRNGVVKSQSDMHNGNKTFYLIPTGISRSDAALLLIGYVHKNK